MTSDRLMIWRFAEAPNHLKSLHRESDTPEWLVLIPRALSGIDLDELILSGSKPGEVSRYDTPEGDTVYVGNSRLDRLSQDPSTIARSSVMAATQAKRK